MSGGSCSMREEGAIGKDGTRDEGAMGTGSTLKVGTRREMQ